MYALFKDDIGQCSHIVIEQYNKELAEAEFESGECITHEAMVKQVKQ